MLYCCVRMRIRALYGSTLRNPVRADVCVCVCVLYQRSVVHCLRLAGPERQDDYPECCTAVARCHSF